MVKQFNLPPSHPDRINLILASTGSVATIKIPILLDELRQSGKYNIVFLPSHTSSKFLPQGFNYETDDRVVTFHDADEWSEWVRGDEILHIELRRWCDILLIAPLSAHSLASIATGHCDSLLLEVLRAWDYSDNTTTKTNNDTSHDINDRVRGQKSLGCAPAMNTAMYLHPFTAQHLCILQETLKFDVLGPIEKTLACGDVGTGAMVEVSTLLDWLDRTSALLRGQ